MNYVFSRVLVTGCAGDIAIAICKILREMNIAENIFGCDINPVGACENFFDTILPVNRADEQTWLKDFQEIIRLNEIDLVIPTVENELAQLVQHNADFTNILAPSTDVISTCLDKWKTARFLKNNGIAVANTQLLQDATFTSKSLVVKPRSGRGSQNIYKVSTETEFIGLKCSLSGTDWVVQELLEPASAEFTCGLFRSTSGDVRTITFSRKLKGGMTVSGVVEKNHVIDEMLTSVAMAFQLCGAINVQCILTDSGPKIFEINPRFSSTVRFRHLLGFQDVIWSILDYNYSPIPSFVEPASGTKFIRAYDEIII